jgi:hypothetical protein
MAVGKRDVGVAAVPDGQIVINPRRGLRGEGLPAAGGKTRAVAAGVIADASRGAFGFE